MFGDRALKKQKSDLCLVSASSQVRLGDVQRVRDLCPVFVCFSEFSVRVQPESAPNTAAGEGNLLPGSLSSPVPRKSLIPDGVIKLYIGYNIHCCLAMYVLHAV